MFSRLKLSYVTIALAGFGLMACGDDSGSAEGGESAAGATAGRAGSAGRAGLGGRGASGRGGGAGRGSNRQMCPMTEPAMGSTCMPAQGTCMAGDKVCDCIAPGNTWACWNPTDCPTAVPPEQSSCPVVGMTCSPTRNSNCRCTANGWDCGNQYCPPAEPALGSMCDEGTGSCTFGARTCDCVSNAWVCWGASDCPNPPPADNSMCPLNGVNCMYEGGSCQCSGMRGWRCGRGVMNDPQDAGL